MGRASLENLNRRIIACRRCERLVAWREDVAARKAARFRHEDYWGKPVPGFGDPSARLLVVGLAPAAHGANRTGRMFTGDRSGDWLYRALHTFGFASRPDASSRDNGLKLIDCYITAGVRCAPPDNKPTPEERSSCRPFLLEELQLLRGISVVVVLGKIAADTAFDAFRELGRTHITARPRFGHGIETVLSDRTTMLASFHPSQQNTFTGKLTAPMFDRVFRRARALLSTEKKNGIQR